MIEYYMIYLAISVVVFYVQQQKHAIVELLVVIKDVKTREKIKKEKERIKLDMILSIVWPILFIKELYNVVKQKIKSKNT